MKIYTLFALLLFAGLLNFAAMPSAKFTYHTVAKGETVYSISRQYGIKPAELAQYNESMGDKFSIKIGQKLKVPTSIEAEDVSAEAAPVQAAIAASESYHIVKKGETVFSISREYNVSRSDFQMWNNLEDLSLKVGQKVVIKKDAAIVKEAPKAATSPASAQNGPPKIDERKASTNWTSSRGAEANVSTASADVTASAGAVGLASTKTVKSWKVESVSERMDSYHPKSAYDPSSEYESLYYQNVYSGLAKKTERGVAKTMTDNNSACVAYYNNAGVGTILKVTNPDNGKTTYAIVVGKIPPAENNAFLLKLSDRVARNLTVRDYSSVEVICYTAN